MKQKYLLIGLAFVFLTTTGLASTIYLKKYQNQPKSTNNESGNIYKNEEYGFQLTLPPEFEKYSVEIYKSNNSDEFPGFDIVEFWLPTDNGDMDYLFFAIVCCPVSKIPEIKERCSDEFQSIHFHSAYNCQPIEDSIGKNDKYVFSIMGPHEDPEGFWDQFENDIIKNFEPIPFIP